MCSGLQNVQHTYTFKNSSFLLQIVFVFFTWFSEETAIISLNIIFQHSVALGHHFKLQGANSTRHTQLKWTTQWEGTLKWPLKRQDENNGRAIAQAVSRWLPTAAVRGSKPGLSSGILWWTKWRWGQFSPSTSVSSAKFHSTNCSKNHPHLSSGFVQ
jgi:hypothetical protein